MKNRVIANNPLSQNIARHLKLDPNNPRDYLEKINDVAEKMTKAGTKIDGATIDTWIQARDDDPTRSLKWPSLERLIPFSKVIGVNYQELFIPDTYLKFSTLSPLRKQIVAAVLRVDESYLNYIKGSIAGLTRDEMEKVDKESQIKKSGFQEILTILELSPN